MKLLSVPPRLPDASSVLKRGRPVDLQTVIHLHFHSLEMRTFFFRSHNQFLQFIDATLHWNEEEKRRKGVFAEVEKT